MKLFVPVFCFVFFLTFFQYSESSAQTAIAVIDVERALSEAKAGKDLNKRRLSAREKLLSGLTKKEKSLRDEGQKLFAKRKDLSDEEFAKEQKVYQEKVLEMRKDAQKKRVAFEKTSNEALNKLQDHLSKSVKAVAKEKGYELVISNRNVIVGEGSLDVTDETIKVMDSDKVTIPFNVGK